MAEGTVQQFLSAVWGNRKGFVFIPYKDLEGGWNEPSGIPFDGGLESLPRIRASQGDFYFCPLVFSKPKRKKEFAQDTNLLWADLDYAHPDKLKLKPTIAWESSPGRYQALWFLSSEIPAEDAAQLSKRIAYAEGADRGGWDVTQVLRIPGTRNHKYDMAPPVKLLWADRFAYSPGEIRATYPAVNGDSHQEQTTKDWPVVAESVVQSAIQSLPLGLKRRLTRNPAGADRSKELQLLARDLLRRGITEEVLPHVLQRSTFNKFAGRPTEQVDLLKQVADAASAVAATPARTKAKPLEDSPIERMEVHQWAGFMSIPTKLRWLVDDAWVDGSVGFISGRSKSYKTWMALDLALSLVSGAPFLGRYQVRRTGPVVLVQEEDPAPVLQERLRLIGKSKGMLPEITEFSESNIHIEFPEYPLHVINLQGFNLGAEEKIGQLRELIAEVNPVAVILDPLIVMLAGTGADENKATDVSLVLQAVKQWREEFGCSIIIVHHWNKGKPEEGDRFAQQMYGSFVFHAWLESALHIMPVIEEGQDRIDTVLVEREFKAAPSGRALKLKFNIDSTQEYTYKVEFEDDATVTATMQQLLDLLTDAGADGMTTPEIVQVTGHPRPKIADNLNRLVRRKMIKVIEKGGGRGRSTRYGVTVE